MIHIHNEDVETGQPVKKRKITHPAVSTGGENIDHGFGGLGEDAGAGFGMEFANGLDETGALQRYHMLLVLRLARSRCTIV